MNFIDAFIDYTKEYESPTSFWRWASYSLISAVLRDNVYLEHNIHRTYPNMYVVLLATSSQHRKGGPFPLMTEFLNEINHTKLIAGRGSVQAIIEELSQDIANGKSGTPIRGGSCLLLAEELASFFVADVALIPLMTDIYEFRKTYTYRLKSAGTTNIKNLCVGMFAASNETFLREVYTNGAVYGGLLGRTFVVKPNETRPPNSLLDSTAKPSAHLLTSLTEIKKLNGPISISPTAKAKYIEWYNELYANYDRLADRTGMTQRMHKGVLKIATILACADLQKEISENHITEAILQVTSLRANYEVFAMSASNPDINKSTGAIGAIVLETLLKSPNYKLSRRDLLFKHWAEFSAQQLDEFLNTVEQGGLIKTIASHNEITYELTPRFIEHLERKLKAKSNGHIGDSTLEDAKDKDSGGGI